MQKMLKRFGVIAAAGAVVATLMPAPAYAYVYGYPVTTAPVRVEPYGSAHAVDTVDPGEYVLLECSLINRYGNHWYRTRGGRFYTYAGHYPSYNLPNC
ncbi:hypothetical protein ACIBFB_02595 [Nocardiopsis sp. NPDC050513]|uniref:hypothetical protein n=1 Tax=Nocardiopsis sp. NPDC050513 TaxID=3364338 RepID=UPI003790CCBD